MYPSNLITQVQRPTKPLITSLIVPTTNNSALNDTYPNRDLVNSPRTATTPTGGVGVGVSIGGVSSTTQSSTSTAPLCVSTVPSVDQNHADVHHEYEESEDNTDSDIIDQGLDDNIYPPVVDEVVVDDVVVVDHELLDSPPVPWQPDHLLPPLKSPTGKKCLVLDLDETLVHSSFQPTVCDFEIPLQLEGQIFKVYVAKRPHVDEFMKVCGRLYEVVVFTASLAAYADAVLDLLDVHKVVDWRLFRESCSSTVTGAYVKDLQRIGRSIDSTIIIDNSPHSYSFNPLNAVPIQSWFDDKDDKELLTLIPILERLASPTVTDVKTEIQSIVEVSGLELLASTFTNFGIAEQQQEEEEYVEEDRYDQQQL